MNSDCLRIKVGVIGGGVFAQNNHIPCLLAQQDVSLAWVSDKNTARLNSIERMYGITTTTVELLPEKISEVDVVLLSLPYGVRTPYYDLCAQQGCHVYVEKPFARSTAEHDDIASKFQDNMLTIGFNRRYYKNLAILIQILSTQMFGPLSSISIRQGFFSLSGWSGFRSDARLSGGGVLIESGIHLLDTALVATKAKDIQIDNVRMATKDGIDYHTEASGSLMLDESKVLIDIEISCLKNFNSGIWFRFDGAELHYPMSPSEPITLRNTGNHVIGRIELDVNGATTVAQSLDMTWQACLKNIRQQAGTKTITPNSCRLTSKALELLYTGGME